MKGKNFLKTQIGQNKTGLIITGALIGISITVLAMLILSFIMLVFGLDDGLSAPFATLSLGLGAFSAAFYASRKVGSRGYLVGLIVGIISFLTVLLISLFVSKQSIGANTVFHLVIIVISSLIGGILGVNFKSSKKFI